MINHLQGRIKHTLQWKFVLIMFFSLFCGIAAMATAEAVVYGAIFQMSPEEGEVAFAKWSALFDLLFLVITTVVFLCASRPVIKRIEKMNKNVEKITQGTLRGLGKDKHHDELGTLSDNINLMADSIAASLEKEQNMICNLAHDLRTPITSIRGYVELLEQRGQLSDEGKEYLAIVSRKSKDLSLQVADLLEYSMLTFKEKNYEFQQISLSSLLEQVLIDFIPSLEREGIRYTLTGNTNPCLYHCNQLLMVRLLENLITNGIRYGKSGKKLELAIQSSKDAIEIFVSNYGKCLSPEEQEHLFESLYQGIAAKEYQTESKGLGLSIAKEIVRIHHGTIQAYNEEDKKVTFRVTLPIDSV